MPYTPVTYNTGAAPGLDGPAFNAMETQYQEAINSFEQDLFTPFVFGGLVATKDGVTASQLDVTAGTAFPKQTDSSLRRRSSGSANYSTSGHPSTTMYLDLNPDGSWSWGTAHSATANYLPIASVTTDSSSNIATVTDARTLGTTLLNGMAGALTLPATNIAASMTVAGQIISNVPIGSNSPFIWTGSVGSSALVMLDIRPTDVGQPHWQLIYNGGDQHFQIQNASAGIDALDIDASGNVAVHGSFTANGSPIIPMGVHSTAGQPALSIGSGAPSTLGTGEVYVQIS